MVSRYFDKDNLVHDGWKVEQDIPNSYADNFSRDKLKNDNIT